MFQGYHTVARWADVPLHEAMGFLHLDHRAIARQHPPHSIEGIEPMNPLHAASNTLGHLSAVHLADFYAGNVVVDVINVRSQTVETYDDDRLGFEMNLERLCG